MSEVTSGVRAVLAHPGIYRAWSVAVGGRRCAGLLVRDHVRPADRARILDIGCGPGDMRAHLPRGVDYVGVDISPAYIERARERYGQSAQFRVGDATALGVDLGEFDIVLAFGVLHHLDDAQATALLLGAGRALRRDGRVVTIDPAITRPQRVLARAVITRDRGQHVREPRGYLELARSAFERVVPVERTDLLHIPYTHYVMECAAPSG